MMNPVFNYFMVVEYIDVDKQGLITAENIRTFLTVHCFETSVQELQDIMGSPVMDYE